MSIQPITPQESHAELGKALGLTDSAVLYFKREDLHRYGSHKGRSIPYMIDEKLKLDCSHFAISSSGNAALASAMYVKELNEKRKEKITMEILVGKHINTSKLEKLESLKDENILLSIQDRPLQALFMKTQDPAIQSLRQSTDPLALVGYESLARELENIPELKAIFIGTSSGTTAQALAEYFKDKGVEIHIIQSSSCHPMSNAFVKYDGDTTVSFADAIVDTVAPRKSAITSLISHSGGSGYIATNEEISSAIELVDKHAHIVISPNSALSVVGLMQAIYTGKSWNGSVVCMIMGN